MNSGVSMANLLHVADALKRTWETSLNYSVASGKLNIAILGVIGESFHNVWRDLAGFASHISDDDVRCYVEERTNFLEFEWVYAFNYATEVDQLLWPSGEVDVASFKQQFESRIYRPKESDVGLDAWASLAKELEARDVAEVVAISQPISVAIPEPYRSGYETDQCADATWGFDRIDSVDLPFTKEYEWETAFPDGGAGTNVYVFDTGINVNNGDFGGRAINRYSCVSRRCYSLCAAVISCTDNDENGRGTHVAGTVTGSRYGVAKHATIHSMQVLGVDRTGTVIGVLNAMEQIVSSLERQIFQMSITSSKSTLWDNTVDTVTNYYAAIVVWREA